MNYYNKEVIKLQAQSMKPGFIEEVEKRNTNERQDSYCLTDDDIQFIKKTFDPKYQEMKFPSIPRMIKNAAEAAILEGAAILNNDPPASLEEQGRRILICNDCEFFSPNIPAMSEEQKQQKRCIKCGCFMAFKSKLRSAHCPVNKW